MLPNNLQHLIKALRIFPGVGKKTAQRYALYLIRDMRNAQFLYNNLSQAINSLVHCQDCGALYDLGSCCVICNDASRDRSVILVLPSLFDMVHFEDLGCYNGLYHILGGCLSPLDGIGPEDLNLKNLLNRIEHGGVKEVILSFGPTLEGNATCYYIGNMLKPLDIKISRLATGIPVGETLEHMDVHTLSLSIQQRYGYSQDS